jgi:hypothetical protein
MNFDYQEAFSRNIGTGFTPHFPLQEEEGKIF